MFQFDLPLEQPQAATPASLLELVRSSYLRPGSSTEAVFDTLPEAEQREIKASLAQLAKDARQLRAGAVVVHLESGRPPRMSSARRG